MMIVPRLTLLATALVSGLPAASVEERLSSLEARMSEMQILVERLSKKSLAPAPAASSTPSRSGKSYEIRPGDSYWSIARRHGLTVEALTAANPGVPPRRLTIGKSIVIPGSFPSSPTTQASSPAEKSGPRPSPKPTGTRSYRVRKGDVLGRIAGKHGISLGELMAANPGVDPRRLRIGKILTIPGQEPPVPEPPVETKSGLPEAQARVPRAPSPAAEVPAESPYAKALDDSASKAASMSGAKSGLEAPPRLITLAEDTRFSEIASRFETTVDRLNELNRRKLSPDQMIKEGSQIYVPGQ